MKKLFLFTLLLMYSVLLVAQNKPEPVSPFDTGNMFARITNQSNGNVISDGAESILDAFTNAGNRLVALQNNDGGWDWPLDDGDPNSVSPLNTLGPITMGLAQAYQQTGSVTQRTTLLNAGTYLLTKTNNFSPSDGYLAAQLDKIFDGTTYTAHVKTNFYNQLVAGTYDYKGLGTLYNTADYVNYIRTNRAGSQANLAAWDVGMGLVGAAMCGASTTEWIAGVKAEINELNGDYTVSYYDVIGLAGAVYGLAYVNEDFDPTAGQHAAASNIDDLADILASYQINGGGFAWNQAYVIPGDLNESIQETAYSILALNEVNRTLYLTNIEGAADYMMSVQLGTGGWSNDQFTISEYNEVTAEALWGISAAYPAPVFNLTKDVYYPTIQGAINDATSGNTITVAAGTYTEDVLLNKSVIIKGANFGVNPNTMPRTDESIVAGTFILNANNITIDGFNVTPNSTGAYGVRAFSGSSIHNNISITNNKFTNLFESAVRMGLGFGGGVNSSNWLISDNKIDNIQGTDKTALILFNITNLMVSGNFISHSNDIYNGRRGMNLDGCQNVNIVNNNVNMGLINPAPDNSDGSFTKARYPIQISCSDRATTDVNIGSNVLGGAYDGIVTLGNGNYSNISILDNTFSNVVLGIRFQAGTNGPTGSHTNFNITGNTVNSSNRCVYLQDGTSGGSTADPYTNIIINNNNLIRSSLGFTLELAASAIITDPPLNAENNWWGTAVESEIQALISGDVDYDPWIGKTNALACPNVNVNYNFLNGVIIRFTTLPNNGGNVTVMRENKAPASPPSGVTNLGLWIDITSSMPNFSFNGTVIVDVNGIPGFNDNSKVMYRTPAGNWMAIAGGTYNPSDGLFGGHPSYSFATNHFTPFTFINTPASAYDVYLSSSTSTTAGIIYPNDAWGITGYEANDWDFTAPIELYIVPEVGTQFGACSITLEWDNTMFTLDTVINDGIFSPWPLAFQQSQLGSTSRVTIDASRTDLVNFNTIATNYIAKVTFNLLKPGYGAVNFIGMDFRYFNGANPPSGVYVTGNNAQVKSYLGDVAASVDTLFTGDGLVDFDDLSPWSSSYWSGVAGYTGGMTTYKVKYDVGPTTTNTVYGLPTVDAKIQFEDLVIFSMSYGLSASHVYPKLNAEPTAPVELQLGDPIISGNQTRVPLFVSGGVQNVRAMNLTFAGTFGKLVSVDKGTLLNELVNPVMVMSNVEGNQVFVDLAVFGADELGICNEGEVLTLIFEGNADIKINTANIRNILNGSMAVNISGSVETVPTEFALMQNYPNPFNPSTMINYSLPTQSMVEISVFNALGEKVATLVNELKEAGRYSVELNSGGFSSGIYFYQITANDFVSVKKMILMK